VLTEIPTEAELLRAVRDPRDVAAWGEFDRLYRPAIYATCRRLGLDPEQAGHLTQDVLIKVAGAMPRFAYDPGRRFRGWIRTVVGNAVRDFREAEAKRRDRGVGGTDHVLAVEGIPNQQSPDLLSDGISVVLEDDGQLQRRVLLAEAVNRVRARLRNPRRWEALWGVLAEGRTTAEVGAELGMSVAAVGMAAKEVLDMLRAEFGRLLHEEGGVARDVRAGEVLP
jgi:RNA polymerase sigma factor (sigma-70 family)